MKRSALLFAASATMLAGACKDKTPVPQAPPVPVAAKPTPPAPTVDGGGVDAHHLGMMERHAIWKAKREAEAQRAAELLAAEKARLIKFDKAKLSKHLALFAFERKTRQAFDKAAVKLNGKIDAADQLKKLALSQQKAINAQITALRAMDPEGGNSAIAADHDVVLQLLLNDYPQAVLAFFQGKTKPLAEVRAVLDKREKKIAAWLEEVKASKEAKSAKEEKASKEEKSTKEEKASKEAKAAKGEKGKKAAKAGKEGKATEEEKASE